MTAETKSNLCLLDFSNQEGCMNDLFGVYWTIYLIGYGYDLGFGSNLGHLGLKITTKIKTDLDNKLLLVGWKCVFPAGE